MAINKVCPTCDKRDVVVDNGCAICLFFRSDEEQAHINEAIETLFDSKPEVIAQTIEDQVKLVVQALPYICTYKAQYLTELQHFVKQALLHSIDEQITEVEDEWLETTKDYDFSSLFLREDATV